MNRSIHLKFWFFDNYWWLLVLLAAVATGLLVFIKEPVASVAAMAGAVLSLLYFVQKQRLEEVRLFRELFKEFNERYDAMNDRLARIRDIDDGEFAQGEAQLLIDYFNLCGEEYLYFSKGYIPPSVWEAWYLGMQQTISCPRINELWRGECAGGSYYGLPLRPFKHA